MLIASGALPGRRAKEQAGHGAAAAFARQILQVLPHGAAVAQIVELMQEGFEEPSIGRELRADFPQLQRSQVGQWRLDGLLTQAPIQCGHLLVPHSIGRGPAPDWQPDDSSLLQLEQQSSGGHVLELARTTVPVPHAGQFTAEPVTTPAGVS